MRRRTLIAALAALPTAARATTPTVPPISGPNTPQTTRILAFYFALHNIMTAGKSVPFARRVAVLAPAIDAGFDLPAILAASVGPRWAGFPEDQRTALLAAFRDFTIATWVANFDSYEGQRFAVEPEPRAIGNDRAVASRIIPPSGDPTRLDFVVREGPQGWRAIDILVDGTISRTAVQRADFRALLKDNNPAPLIAMLRDKAAELARN